MVSSYLMRPARRTRSACGNWRRSSAICTRTCTSRTTFCFRKHQHSRRRVSEVASGACAQPIMRACMLPPREQRKAAFWGCVVTALLAALIVVGSRNLNHFDAALVGYTFATLFAAFAITYRYAMWLQRPPTRMYWRRGWSVFLSPRFIGGEPGAGPRRVFLPVAG